MKRSTYREIRSQMQRLAENWILTAKDKSREVFSELDVLLRALDRFFNLENLPLSKEDIANKSFYDELSAVRDTLLRIVGLIDAIIPETKKNVYWFQKFAHSKFLTDRKRDAFREEMFKQDVPEKSLFLLYDSLVNLKGIISDILKTEHIPYLSYTNIGQILGRELRENVYFNPFRKDINPEFDVIENSRVSMVTKGIKDQELKKQISLLFLYLFKFLRYLRYADTSVRFGSLSSSLLIILLLRSEFAQFLGYVDNVARRITDEGLKMALRTISYQFSMETKRVFLQELKGIFKNRSPQYLKGKIENSHGILKNLCEQSIVQIVYSFKPDIEGEEIFETFVTRREQSLRLREDICILQRFLILMEAAEGEKRMRVFTAMRNFMLYFQSFTFKLLRYDDYEEFSSFFEKVLGFGANRMDGKTFDKLLDRIRQFRIFVETSLGQISNRTELADTPPDVRRIEDSVKQYLG